MIGQLFSKHSRQKLVAGASKFNIFHLILGSEDLLDIDTSLEKVQAKSVQELDKTIVFSEPREYFVTKIVSSWFAY